MWHKYPNEIPPNIPKEESFGVVYEVKYQLPNGDIKTDITEWLWDKTWNYIYPVIAWRQYKPILNLSKV